MNKGYCQGRNKSGYMKGYPCGHFAMFEQEGKYYCVNHLDVTKVARVLSKEERQKMQKGEK